MQIVTDRRLTFRAAEGDLAPLSATKRKASTANFFATDAVFSLDETTVTLVPPGDAGKGGRL